MPVAMYVQHAASHIEANKAKYKEQKTGDDRVVAPLTNPPSGGQLAP